MNRKQKDGYIAGSGFVIAFFIFLAFAISIGWKDLSGQAFSIITVFCGIIGFGSLWKPETVGSIAVQILEKFSDNEEKPTQIRKQTQKNKFSGNQVMTGNQSNITIIQTTKEKNENNTKSQDELMLLREARIIAPKKNHVYEIGDFDEGDNLIGELTSTCPITISLMHLGRYHAWEKGEPTDSTNCTSCKEEILETDLYYVIPFDGSWYIVIENKGKEPATVRVRLSHKPSIV
jgi:hypothetical protein